MFQSYKTIKYLGKKDGNYSYQYELTDSEFGTVSGVGVEAEVGVEVGVGVAVAVAVIQEYSKRKLNVAANLALAFIWYNKNNPYYSIQQLIYYNKKFNPLFPQYEEDLQKYLLLL